MSTYTFIIYDLANRRQIKQVKFPYTGQSGITIRSEARKAAGFHWCPFSQVWDRYGNEILYTRKNNGFVYIVEDTRLRDGAYEPDPISAILDNPAALAAARSKNRAKPEKGQRIRQQHHAERIAEHIKINGIDGVTLTPRNAPEIRDQIRRELTQLKKDQSRLWDQYEKDAAAKAAQIAAKAAQRDAITAYIRRYPSDSTPQTYTAQHANQEAHRTPAQTATEGPQDALQAVQDFDFI